MTKEEARDYIATRGLEMASEDLKYDTDTDIEYYAEVWLELASIFEHIEIEDEVSDMFTETFDNFIGLAQLEKEVTLEEEEILNDVIDQFEQTARTRDFEFDAGVRDLVTERYEYRGYQEWANNTIDPEEIIPKIDEIIAKNERQNLDRLTDVDCIIDAACALLLFDDIDIDLCLDINARLISIGMPDESNSIYLALWMQITNNGSEMGALEIKNMLIKESVISFNGIAEWREPLYKMISNFWFGENLIRRYGRYGV